jgi:glycosyltransferase involved in cell wall biosynthesis
MEYKPRKKILHVIGNLEGGGAEKQLQILVNNTNPEIYHISILFLYGVTSHCEYKEGINFLHIPRGYKWNVFSLWLRVYRAVMAYKPDILHLWLPEIITIPAAFAGRLSGAYILSSARGSRRSVKSIKRRIRHILDYVAYMMADTIIANFNPQKEPSFFRYLFSKKQGHIIPNAIVIRKSENNPPPSLFAEKNASFKIWCTGRIISSKRIDILLDSFFELRREGLDISLIICGTGELDLLKRLKQKVEVNNLNNYVIFPGYRNDWHSLSQDADLFVLPSTAEGMPNVLFEAMLLGIPCIAADIPVIKDIVTHKVNIWLVKAGSRESLTAGIRELYHSTSLRNQLAKAGQEYTESFSIEKMVEAYDFLYNMCRKSEIEQADHSKGD